MIYEKIKEYKPYNDHEEADKKLILDFINKNPDYLLRTNLVAHLTTSCIVLNQRHDSILMCYHNIFNSWSWLGGHNDGEEDCLLVAIKEAKEENIKFLFPILIGIVMITKSSLDIRLSLSLKNIKGSNWLLLFICAILSVICGIIIIINPNLGSIAITTYVGIVLTIYSITNIIDTIIFKKYINDIVKVFK